MNVETLAPLATPRLSGEPFRQSHYEELHELHTDPVLMKYLGGVKTEAQTQEYLERNLAHWAQRGFGIWLLRAAETGELVGRAGLRTLEVDDAVEVELGYGLRPSFWGHGLATEVALECLKVAREHLALPSVVATTVQDNDASKRVMGRIGMKFEREVRLFDMPLDLFRVQLGAPSNTPLQPTDRAGARPAAERPSRSTDHQGANRRSR